MNKHCCIEKLIQQLTSQTTKLKYTRTRHLKYVTILDSKNIIVDIETKTDK